jgi:hypothetical protein
MYSQEPNDENIVRILKDLFLEYQPAEQTRWVEADINARFWSGDQGYVSSFYGQNFSRTTFNDLYFNIIRQPVLSVSGRQRQQRKSISVVPLEDGSQKTADQFNKLMQFSFSKRNLLEKFSLACEQSLVVGLVLLQPFLDYREDPINGVLDLKVWEFSSFMSDIYWRSPDMSDCNWVVTQHFVSKQDALVMYPDKEELIHNAPTPVNDRSSFYFLPENYNMPRSNRLILTNYWYKSFRKQKKLYNHKTQEISEWKGKKDELRYYLKRFPFLEEITMSIPTWRKAVLLDQTIVYSGLNPLGGDACPFIPMFFDYEPWQSQYPFRNRSLVTYLRAPQYLFNRRVILNHSISETCISAGWKFKEGSLVNEEVVSLSIPGTNVILKRSADMADVEKIVANEVPPSNMALADQLQQLMSPISGVYPENLGSGDDNKAAIIEMLRSNAGIIGLQKYFDQWDMALKCLGMVCLEIFQNNWSAFKVSRIIKEQPTDEFYDKNFSKYDCLPQESVNTTTQRQQHFAELLQLKQMGIDVPISTILKASTLQGKDLLIQDMEAQEQQNAAMAKEKQHLEMALLDSQLQQSQAITAEKFAMAKERYGRSKSNIGLLSERYSELSKNHAIAAEQKMKAVKTFLETVQLYGQTEAEHAMRQVDSEISKEEVQEHAEETSDEQQLNLDVQMQMPGQNQTLQKPQSMQQQENANEENIQLP